MDLSKRIPLPKEVFGAIMKAKEENLNYVDIGDFIPNYRQSQYLKSLNISIELHPDRPTLLYWLDYSVLKNLLDIVMLGGHIDIEEARKLYKEQQDVINNRFEKIIERKKIQTATGARGKKGKKVPIENDNVFDSQEV